MSRNSKRKAKKMARNIKITDEMIDEMRAEFESKLATARLSDGKFDFSKTFTAKDAKADLFMTPIAWMKTNLLVAHVDKEVAWHGTARRLGNNQYIIDDVIVYPQRVAAATVEADEGYKMWLVQRDDFDSIRMQGHSHVNMGTTPSGTDTGFYKEILDQLREDDFYIFGIWNKRGEYTLKIYDMEINTLFETADISLKILDNDSTLQNFLEEADKLVKPAVPAITTPAYTSSYNGSYGGGSYGDRYAYDGYYGDYYKGKYNNIPEYKKTTSEPKNASEKHSDAFRKGKRTDIKQMDIFGEEFDWYDD